MKIEYITNASFLFTFSDGTTVLTDPWYEDGITISLSSCKSTTEDEQRRFRCQLHADAEKLPLFHVEAFSQLADHSFRKVFHPQHVDNVLHVLVLVLFRDRPRLAQDRAEAQRFPDRGSFKMHILLLDVACSSRET